MLLLCSNVTVELLSFAGSYKRQLKSGWLVMWCIFSRSVKLNSTSQCVFSSTINGHLLLRHAPLGVHSAKRRQQSLQSGHFWAISIASFREKFFGFCIVLNHVIRGHPSGLLQSSPGERPSVFPQSPHSETRLSLWRPPEPGMHCRLASDLNHCLAFSAANWRLTCSMSLFRNNLIKPITVILIWRCMYFYRILYCFTSL